MDTPRPGGSRADGLTAVAGLRVGHWTDAVARTGCTVVRLPPAGAPTSALAFGPAPASREYALLDPDKSVPVAHAIVLSGGSAYGLDAASGVMRLLEREGIGLETPFARVPIVPAAALYDLGVGRPDVRPDAASGEGAAKDAHDGPVASGRIGAGSGATVGKIRGFDAAVPSGIGSAAVRVGNATVAALAVSNAVGALVDPNDGRPIAGRPAGAEEAVNLFQTPPGTNTTLVVVATDAALDKTGCRALAPAGHVGIAHVTRPSHTPHDGDTVFVTATGRAGQVDSGPLSVAVQQVVAEAILRGARKAVAS